MKFLLSETDPTRVPPAKSEAAFVGRSNVGKSSLLNALLGKDLARVSSTPGRTRTINVYESRPGRWLVDLPGYGFALGKIEERETWAPMIEGYLTSRPNLRMVFALIDAKVGPTKQDLDMLKWLEVSRLPWTAVATKGDQVPRSKAQARRRELEAALGLEPQELVWVSAEEGWGVGPLRDLLNRLLAQK